MTPVTDFAIQWLRWAKRAYSNLIFYRSHPKGGHFAAWEQPELFVSDVRATFKSLRGTA